jgi:hypothetical protein
METTEWKIPRDLTSLWNSRNLVCRDFDLLDRYPKTSDTLYRNSPK